MSAGQYNSNLFTGIPNYRVIREFSNEYTNNFYSEVYILQTIEITKEPHRVPRKNTFGIFAGDEVTWAYHAFNIQPFASLKSHLFRLFIGKISQQWQKEGKLTMSNCRKYYIHT